MNKTLIILLILFFSCNSNTSKQKIDKTGRSIKINADSVTKIYDSFDYQLEPFLQLKNYPLINDTSTFIQELKNNCHIGGIFFKWGDTVLHETINIFKKVNLNGTNKTYYLLEYDWHGNNPNTEFPWKKQLLFDSSGKLIRIFQALRIDFIKIFPTQNPYLLTCISSAHGNGGHEIYKVSADTLENVYEGYCDYKTQTYMASEDRYVYEPNELKLVIKDFNKDGLNDIAFVGKLVLIQGVTKDSIWYDYETFGGKDTISYSLEHPFKKIAIRYTFLYNNKTNHFAESDKYSNKNPLE